MTPPVTTVPTLRPVLENRIDQRQKCGRSIGDVIERAFPVAPPVVPSAAARWLVVDLFTRPLPDVADDDRAGATVCDIVEAPAPRVAKAEAPDLAKIASSRPQTGCSSGTMYPLA